MRRFVPFRLEKRVGFFNAAMRLQRILMNDQGLTLTEEDVQNTLLLLGRCEEGHLLATVSALLLALVEGKRIVQSVHFWELAKRVPRQLQLQV